MGSILIEIKLEIFHLNASFNLNGERARYKVQKCRRMLVQKNKLWHFGILGFIVNSL